MWSVVWLVQALGVHSPELAVSVFPESSVECPYEVMHLLCCNHAYHSWCWLINSGNAFSSSCSIVYIWAVGLTGLWHIADTSTNCLARWQHKVISRISAIPCERKQKYSCVNSASWMDQYKLHTACCSAWVNTLCPLVEDPLPSTSTSHLTSIIVSPPSSSLSITSSPFRALATHTRPSNVDINL